MQQNILIYTLRVFMRSPFIRNKFFIFMTFLKYLFSSLDAIGKHLFPFHSLLQEWVQRHSKEIEYDYGNNWRRQWQPTPVLLPGKSHGRRGLVGCSPWGHQESETTEDFTLFFHFHALEKEMATHSSVLAWRIPGTGEPGGLPSLGSHRVGHN